jgi:hypothetical protein
MQCDLADVGAEGSSAVVIFAVDIVSDRATDSDESSSGRDRKEPSFGKENIDDFGKTNPAFAAECPRGFIETQESVETPAID